MPVQGLIRVDGAEHKLDGDKVECELVRHNGAARGAAARGGGLGGTTVTETIAIDGNISVTSVEVKNQDGSGTRTTTTTDSGSGTQTTTTTTTDSNGNSSTTIQIKTR